MKKLLGLVSLMAFGTISIAQPVTATLNNSNQQTNGNVPPNKYLEYNYSKLNVQEREVSPYAQLREADVVYAKRIERVIDVREKKNLPMQWPKNPLAKILYSGVTEGESNQSGRIKAYRDGDSLTETLTVAEVLKIGGTSETIQIPNPNNPDDPYDLIDTTIVTEYDYEAIVRWTVKEEWIFDKQRGIFEPRIYAIAPMYILTIGGEEIGEYPMFWFNYKELRPILIKEECLNVQNDAMQFTYYDWFEQRLFSSYVSKESNVMDDAIRFKPEFKDDPMEALYESERIKEKLFNWEHDLWEY
jgi:gliding motility associated protien GldN